MRALRSWCLAALVAGALASAAGEAGAVTVAAGTGSAMAGQTVDITLTAGNTTGHGIVAYQFVITYNGSVVTPTDVLEAGTLSAGWGDATFNVGAGSIAVSHAGTTALTGSGPLLRIRFVVNPAQLGATSSAVTFQTFTFNEGVPNDTTSNGSITVPATPVITVSPNTGEIVRGQTLPFTVSASAVPPVTWSTTDNAVATISGAGVLTGVAPGEVRVIAVDNAARRDTSDGVVLVRGMGVTVGSASVLQGQTVTVPVTTTDLSGLAIRAGQFQITFTATHVTPVAITTPPGTLLNGYATPLMGVTGNTITVDFAGTSTNLTGAGTLFNLQFTASATATGGATLGLTTALFNETLPARRTGGTITVNALPTITVNPEDVTLLAGQTQQFTLGGSPTAPVTWSTLDPTVAQISPTGLLTALAGGVTRVRAVDNVGATDDNGSVTVYDFQLTVGTVNAKPGGTIDVPILLDRDIAPLGVRGLQYTLQHHATHITAASAGATGLLAAWAAPTTNPQSGRIRIAAAGTQSLGGHTLLQYVRLTVSPSTPVGTQIPLVATAVVFNEGRPSARLVSGTLHVVSAVDVDDPAGGALELASPWPNPSRSRTTIAFTLPSSSVGGAPVTVALYGLDGGRVRTLADRTLQAGRYTLEWDGRDDRGRSVAAGVYFVRLTWGGSHLERKLVVMP